jgi:hypothetical protein
MVAMVVGKESGHSVPKTRPASSQRWQLTEGFDTADLKEAKALLDELTEPATAAEG